MIWGFVHRYDIPTLNGNVDNDGYEKTSSSVDQKSNSHQKQVGWVNSPKSLPAQCIF